MRTKNLLRLFAGIGALAFALGMNVNNAVNDYGIKTNSISPVVWVSATTGGDVVVLPCEKEDEATCTFPCMDASGIVKECKISGKKDLK